MFQYHVPLVEKTESFKVLPSNAQRLHTISKERMKLTYLFSVLKIIGMVRE